MADELFNISKGKAREYHDRVANNDPANSVITLVLLQTSVSDALLRDFDNLSLLLADPGVDEADFTNYARIELSDTDLSVSTVDDTNDRAEADMPDPVWTNAGGATNNNLVKLLFCFDSDSGAGNDTNIIPIGHADFVVTTNGTDLTAQINALGWLRSA